MVCLGVNRRNGRRALAACHAKAYYIHRLVNIMVRSVVGKVSRLICPS